jgi:hypothetical protein
MDSEQIQNFLSQKASGKIKYVKIDFTKRDSIFGLFLDQEKDFKELSHKNFWRIVPQKHLDSYHKTKDVNLARIFNGAEITRLSLWEDQF